MSLDFGRLLFKNTAPQNPKTKPKTLTQSQVVSAAKLSNPPEPKAEPADHRDWLW